MKKHFSKIVGLSLGIALAIGVGAGIGASNRTTSPVYAAGTDVTFTPGTDTGETSVSKGHVTVTLTTMNNASYYQIYASQSGTFVADSGYVLTAIEFTCTASGTTKYGPGNASSDVGTYSYNGSTGSWSGSSSEVEISTTAQIRMTSLTVTYESNGGVTTYAVTYNANGGTGSIKDTNSPYSSGAEVTVKDSTGFTAPEGKEFSHWYTTASGEGGTRYDPGDTFNIAASTILYAQWSELPNVKVLTVGTNGTTTQNGSTLVSWTNAALTSEAWVGDVHFVPGGTDGNNGFYYSTDTSWRFYSTGYITISIPNGYRFTSIKLTWKTGIPTTPTGMERDKATSPTTYTPVSATTNLDTVVFSRDAANFLLQKAVVSFEEIVLLNQNITASSETVREDQTITVHSDAENDVTWSVVSGSGTTASGASVTSDGVVSVNGPGVVTVKASADGYNDATKQLTFTEKPAGTYYTITFDEDGGSVSTGDMSVLEGETFTFPSPGTKEHYSFLGWTEDLNDFYLAGETSPAVAGNADYLAYWEEDAKYTVTYSADNNGSGSFAHTNNYSGSYTLLPFNSLTGVSASSGYRFKDYTVGGAHKNPGDSIDLNAATSVTVNFEKIPPIDILTASYIGQDSYGDWSSKNGTESYAVYAGNNMKSGNGAIQIRSSNSNSGIVSTSSGGRIKKITVSWNTTDMGASSKTLDVYAKNTPYSAATDLYTGSTQGTKVGSLVYTNTTSYETELTISGNYTYIGVRSKSNAIYLNDISFEWQQTIKVEVENNISSISALKINYKEEAGEIYSYSETAIRFGGLISQNTWNQLNAESSIQGYGVLIAANSDLGGKTIKERYYAAKTNSNTVEQAIGSIHDNFSVGKKIVTSKPNPAVATSEQKAFLGVSGDYYIWTVQKPFVDAFTSKFNAVAFILIDGDIVFLKEVSLSAKDIATRDVPVDDQDTYYEPLHYMANMA